MIRRKKDWDLKTEISKMQVWTQYIIVSMKSIIWTCSIDDKIIPIF